MEEDGGHHHGASPGNMSAIPFDDAASPQQRRTGTTSESPAPVPAGGKASPAPQPQTSGSQSSKRAEPTVEEKKASPPQEECNRTCIYCNEPSSRYCKETGRRHENAEERANRQWKTMFRQLAMASQFVNKARLNKPNTCVEDFGIELDLDSM